jgi:hypothetical protein
MVGALQICERLPPIIEKVCAALLSLLAKAPRRLRFSDARAGDPVQSRSLV